MGLEHRILGGGGRTMKGGWVQETLVFKVTDFADRLSVAPLSFSGLALKPDGLSWKPTEAGEWHVTAVYEGVAEDAPDPETNAENPENFEWLPARSQEPIEAHPLIERMMELYAGSPDEDGKIQFDRYLPESADAADGLPGDQDATGDRTRNPMYGRDKYLAKSGVWRWTFTSRDYPYKWEDQDGRILESVPGGRRTPAGKNWMVLFQNAKPVGQGDSLVYNVTIDFALSEKNGWPPPQFIFDLEA